VGNALVARFLWTDSYFLDDEFVYSVMRRVTTCPEYLEMSGNLAAVRQHLLVNFTFGLYPCCV